MSIFEAIGELVTMPIRCAGELVNDLTDNGEDEMSQLTAILTCGLSSVARGVVKTVQKANDKLD